MDMRFKRRDPGNSGQTLLLFTFFMIVLILFLGLGIDMGLAYITRARLSKAVDAACLTGIRAYSSDPVKKAEAERLAMSVFGANYAASGIDTNSVIPTLTWGSANNNITLDVHAATRIETFFIRVLPALFASGDASWQTLPVGSSGQATRPNLILSLVLDRSGSMADRPTGDDGMKNLKVAVPLFLDHFDDGLDRASMSSFSCGARVDVPMSQPFKTVIKTAVSALDPNGWTASDAGLENGREQNTNVVINSGEKVVKVIVFFTDGLANTFQYVFQCGATVGTNNISPDSATWDPADQPNTCTGTDCTIPSCLASINGGCIDRTLDCAAGNSRNFDRSSHMYDEAEARARAVANRARLEGNTIYAIGMADPTSKGECGRPSINPDFLKSIANDPSAADFNKDQLQGLALIAGDETQLPAVFEAVANAILARLTK